jgi:hypothetical protein
MLLKLMALGSKVAGIDHGRACHKAQVTGGLVHEQGVRRIQISGIQGDGKGDLKAGRRLVEIIGEQSDGSREVVAVGVVVDREVLG